MYTKINKNEFFKILFQHIEENLGIAQLASKLNHPTLQLNVIDCKINKNRAIK